MDNLINDMKLSVTSVLIACYMFLDKSKKEYLKGLKGLKGLAFGNNNTSEKVTSLKVALHGVVISIIASLVKEQIDKLISDKKFSLNPSVD